jgi:hypothetical protein
MVPINEEVNFNDLAEVNPEDIQDPIDEEENEEDEEDDE